MTYKIDTKNRACRRNGDEINKNHLRVFSLDKS